MLPRPSCFSHASLVLLGCRNITEKNFQSVFISHNFIINKNDHHLLSTLFITSITVITIMIFLITIIIITWESLLSRGRTKTPRPKGLRLFLEQVAFSYFGISISIFGHFYKINIMVLGFSLFSWNVQIQIEVDCCRLRCGMFVCARWKIFRNLDWNVRVVCLQTWDVCSLKFYLCLAAAALAAVLVAQREYLDPASDSPLIKHC